MDRQHVIDSTMTPYTGPSVRGVDPSTMTGKVLCGYQGWFTTPDDGSGSRWIHYGGRGGFEPGRCSIDLWPDVSELDDDEKAPTPFRHADGSVAYVFSSQNRKTVLRHFQWMKDYGLDGVFVQRFAVSVFSGDGLYRCNTMLGHCREGANLHGRAYAVMYDLSGLRQGQMEQVMADWRLLKSRMQITADKAYLHHKGHPVVAVWGVGFNDNRRYTLAECRALITFLKGEGCTVMLGVPTGWRTFNRDAVRDAALHEVILQGDIVSPWTVGRYRTPKEAERHARRDWAADLAWCRERGKEYLPVVFPGFSWHNMRPDSPLGLIPRLGGKFLWTQYAEAKKAGATMVYQAMFDEMDEGTAIFKCTNDPPVGASKFLTYEGLPSDHYLKLVGKATKMIRGEAPLRETMPER